MDFFTKAISKIIYHTAKEKSGTAIKHYMMEIICMVRKVVSVCLDGTLRGKYMKANFYETNFTESDLINGQTDNNILEIFKTAKCMVLDFKFIRIEINILVSFMKAKSTGKEFYLFLQVGNSTVYGKGVCKFAPIYTKDKIF